MWILSVSLGGHDSSVCLLKNGEIELFLPEERISKIKNDASLPLLSLEIIEEYTNSLDFIIISNCPSKQNFYVDLIFNYFRKKNVSIKSENIFILNDSHHLNHAYCGYHFSPFKESDFLILDGWGSYILDKNKNISVETCTIFDKNFDTIYKKLTNSNLDIGMMYFAITQYLNFGEHGDGKTMGLSCYGSKDDRFPEFIDENYNCNMNFFNIDLTLNTKKYTFLDNMDEKLMVNIAYKIQKTYEDKLIFYVKNVKSKNLILSGGCALNVKANSLIRKEFPEINLFVDPIPNDCGQSIGSGLVMHHKVTGKIKKNCKNVFLGPKYNNKKLKEDINKYIKIY